VHGRKVVVAPEETIRKSIKTSNQNLSKKTQEMGTMEVIKTDG